MRVSGLLAKSLTMSAALDLRYEMGLILVARLMVGSGGVCGTWLNIVQIWPSVNHYWNGTKKEGLLFESFFVYSPSLNLYEFITNE